jgi:hypothetical protein
MFAFYNKHDNTLYNKLVDLSRNIFFYKNLGLKDKFETRIILIFYHFSILLIIFKNKKNTKFPQSIFDNIFLNIEYHMRELGYGDIAVNKKMKTLNKIFYDILLKLEIKEHKKFKINHNIIIEHLDLNKDEKLDIISKISEYLEDFYNFCFELDDKIMIKGLINFKFK